MLKKMMILVVVVLAVAWGVTNLGTSTKTTKIYDYNHETGEYDLVKVEEETIDGLFDEEVEMRFRTSLVAYGI